LTRTHPSAGYMRFWQISDSIKIDSVLTINLLRPFDPERYVCPAVSADAWQTLYVADALIVIFIKRPDSGEPQDVLWKIASRSYYLRNFVKSHMLGIAEAMSF
jgi:hypothetical protein